MQRVRKGRVTRQRKPRFVPRGSKQAEFPSEELRKYTSPGALKQTAFFACLLAAFGFAMVFFASLYFETMELFWIALVPIVVVEVCLGTALIMALMPSYFIFKPSPMDITIYSRLLEFRRQGSVLRVCLNSSIKLTYEVKKQKLRIYGDTLLLLDGAENDSAHDYRIAKTSIFISKDHLEALAKALPTSIDII